MHEAILFLFFSLVFQCSLPNQMLEQTIAQQQPSVLKKVCRGVVLTSLAKLTQLLYWTFREEVKAK